MNRRTWILLLTLNILFCGFGIYFYSLHLFSPLPPRSAEGPVLLSVPHAGRISKEAPRSPLVIYRTNQFHWRDVESGDYRTYIANLRAIGCPENTIKDIILTDVMKLYASRRGQFFQNGHEFYFWETNERRALNARQLEEKERQLARIDKELPGVLRELLGINYEREINKYFVDSQEDERRLGFLDQTKQSAMLSLREEMEGLRERILERTENQELTPEQIAELKQIEKLHRERLAAILSPLELEEYELRTSDTAERLRANLIGFNPTETEFREIYRLRKAFDERFAFGGGDEEKRLAEAALEEQIKVKLGERFADYDRARNRDYRDLVLFAQVHELPSSTALAILEIKEIAEHEARNLLNNRSIAEQDRLTALRSIEAETERGVKDTLGEKLFRKYAQRSGAWLRHLGNGAVGEVSAVH